MTLDELAFDQRVIWRNAAGADIPAVVVDIVQGHSEVQIRVLHKGGAQLLRVQADTLTAATTPEREARARAFLQDKPTHRQPWTSKRYRYE